MANANKKIFVQNTEPRIHGVGANIRLAPGVNIVDAEEWEKAKEIKLIREHYIENEILIEMGPVPTGDALPRDPKEAIRIVDETVSLKLLREWSERENRPLVSMAIKDQIAKVDAMAQGGASK